MKRKTLELISIPDTPEYYAQIEKEILRVFREEIYLPLTRELDAPPKVLDNSRDDLLAAIRSGRISFYRGQFTGRLNSTLTKELRSIGAEWDRTTGTFLIPRSKLPDDVQSAIDVSLVKFQSVADKVLRKLDAIIPAEIADKVSLDGLFDATLWKVNGDIKKSLKGITIAPELTKEGRQRIAKEYSENLQLYIKDFTEKEIIKLRKDIKARAFDGYRYETMVQKIVRSYGVSQNKAKFLARQETSLLMTKFKQVRYEDAGVNEYKWSCVKGSPKHPVRPMHKILDGTIHRWDNPPKVNEKGERKHPGQDYNCRCVAIPIVRF